MLNFNFNAEQKINDNLRVIVLPELKDIDSAKLIKRLGKDEIEKLKNALSDENVKDSAGSIFRFYLDKTPYLVLFLGKELKRPQKMAAALYAAVKNYSEIDVFGAEVVSSSYFSDFIIGLENASYSFDKYCTKKKAEDFDKLESVNFFGVAQPDDMERIMAVTNAVRYARDLGNEPANVLTPYEFVKDVERLNYLKLDIDILDAEQMKQENFGLALAVAQGSCNPPYTAVIQWRGNPDKKEFDCGLVGKGIIYDSGGLSLKGAQHMRAMKQDMSGAADVLSVMKAIALQKLPINVVAVMVMAENMPSADSYKVDDVLISMSGQSVEVINTDAEGRLTLADALWYIQKKFKVKTLIDIATLTGASSVVFGGQYAAILGNDEKLIQQLIAAGKNVDEKLWQLPMDEVFDKWIDSPIADMQNLGKRGVAGTSTAAAFLQRFVHKTTKWAHLDIAGCECDEKTKLSTAFGVQLLLNYIQTNFVK